MLKTLLLLIPLVIGAQGFAQTPVRHLLSDSIRSYTAVAPPANAKGLIIFLPGFHQSVDDLLKNSTFQNLAYIHGLATVFIPYGDNLLANRDAIRLLNEAITSAMKRYNVDPDKVVLGGFSAGGTIALSYAQYCVKYPESYPMIPQGVFVVDAPVDLSWLYTYCQNEIQRNYYPIGVAEAKYVLSILNIELGGAPDEFPDPYTELSPYSMNAENGGNIETLKTIPIRSYHDIDISWHLQKRRRSLLDMHVTPSSSMINQLMLLGNEHAELITTVGTGTRHDGQKHPHSISIIDDTDLIKWTLNNLKIPFNTSYSKQPGK